MKIEIIPSEGLDNDTQDNIDLLKPNVADNYEIKEWTGKEGQKDIIMS